MTALVFNYTNSGLALVSRILNENSVRLSRTRLGIGDVSTSPSKQPPSASGPDLAARAHHNEHEMYKIAFAYGLIGRFDSGAEIKDLLLSLASQAFAGLQNTGPFRTWTINEIEYSNGTIAAPKLDPLLLVHAFDNFCNCVALRHLELLSDPYPLMAWAEWELNGGSLHPFYDACGRISRCFGAAILISGHRLLPLYDSSASYFEHGNQGMAAFAEYVRQRARVCATWIARPDRTL